MIRTDGDLSPCIHEPLMFAVDALKSATQYHASNGMSLVGDIDIKSEPTASLCSIRTTSAGQTVSAQVYY